MMVLCIIVMVFPLRGFIFLCRQMVGVDHFWIIVHSHVYSVDGFVWRMSDFPLGYQSCLMAFLALNVMACHRGVVVIVMVLVLGHICLVCAHYSICLVKRFIYVIMGLTECFILCVILGLAECFILFTDVLCWHTVAS